MKDNILLLLKGMIVGIGQIIPGVSGGMLAITLGLYEKGVNAISNVFSDIKDNLKFLCIVGLGILISVIIFSKIIKYSLNHFYLPTMLLFIGLIVGGVPSLIKKVKGFKKKSPLNIFLTITVFILIIILSFTNFNRSKDFTSLNFLTYISFFFVGVIYAATMVIPGISGTAIMMLIGYYDIVIDIISNLSNISKTISNIGIVLPFAFGLLFGIISISKLMDFLLKKHEVKIYYIILGLVLSSIVIMVIQTLNSSYNVFNIVIGFILLFIGYFVSKKLEKD